MPWGSPCAFCYLLPLVVGLCSGRQLHHQLRVLPQSLVAVLILGCTSLISKSQSLADGVGDGGGGGYLWHEQQIGYVVCALCLKDAGSPCHLRLTVVCAAALVAR